MAKTRPELSWSEAREISADIRDWMAKLAYAMRGVPGDPPHIIRPADALADMRARDRARQAAARLEGTRWEDTEGG